MRSGSNVWPHNTLKTTANQTIASLEAAAEKIADSIPDVGNGDAVTALSQALQEACEGVDGLKTGIDEIGYALEQLSLSTSSVDEAGEGVAALNVSAEALCNHNSLLLKGSRELAGAKKDQYTSIRNYRTKQRIFDTCTGNICSISGSRFCLLSRLDSGSNSIGTIIHIVQHKAHADRPISH